MFKGLINKPALLEKYFTLFFQVRKHKQVGILTINPVFNMQIMNQHTRLFRRVVAATYYTSACLQNCTGVRSIVLIVRVQYLQVTGPVTLTTVCVRPPAYAAHLFI